MNFLNTLFNVAFVNNNVDSKKNPKIDIMSKPHIELEVWTGEELEEYLSDEELQIIAALKPGEAHVFESTNENIEITHSGEISIEEESTLNPFDQWDSGEWVESFNPDDYETDYNPDLI